MGLFLMIMNKTIAKTQLTIDYIGARAGRGRGQGAVSLPEIKKTFSGKNKSLEFYLYIT